MEVFAYIAPTVTVPSDGEASSHLWTHMAADAIGYDPSFSQVLFRLAFGCGGKQKRSYIVHLERYIHQTQPCVLRDHDDEKQALAGEEGGGGRSDQLSSAQGDHKWCTETHERDCRWGRPLVCMLWAAPLLVATHMWSCLAAAHACLPACFLVRSTMVMHMPPLFLVYTKQRKRIVFGIGVATKFVLYKL
ncbi:hypothetical protein B296_00053111 [Ensete ventricosum]|uniref:Uncharacterized protein n=1 Tax=Ensete ventricosum TaxID=4639 RepID=A0A426X754_ENSVE|nr:hypothetical protein B296_00053111 [Ensete ventricosum]